MNIGIILLAGIYGGIIGFAFTKLATKRIVLQECPFPVFSSAVTITAACMLYTSYRWGAVGGLTFFMLIPAWWVGYLTFWFLEPPLGYYGYFFTSEAQEKRREEERTMACRVLAVMGAIICMGYVILKPVDDLVGLSLVALGELLALFPLIGIFWILAGIVLLGYVLLKISYLLLKSFFLFHDCRLFLAWQRAL